MLHKERSLVVKLMVLIPLITFVCIIILLSSIHAEYIVVTPLSTGESKKMTDRIEQFTQQLDVYGQSTDLTSCLKRQGEMIFSSCDEAEVTVYGIQENYSDFRFFRVISGRRIDYSDVSQAKQIAVIDEAAALNLFHGQEAIGQTVSINGADFEIIGICSLRNTSGEKDQHAVYIPISSVENTELKMETMEFLLRSETAALSHMIIQSVVSEWDSSARLFSVQQEVTHTFLPMILASIICIGVLLIICWRLLMQKICSANAHAQEILQHHYIRESMGSLFLWYIPVIAGCLFAILGFYGLIRICMYILTILSTKLPEQILSIVSWKNQLVSFWRENAQCIQVSCYELEMIRIVGNMAKNIYIILTAILSGRIALQRNQKAQTVLAA